MCLKEKKVSSLFKCICRPPHLAFLVKGFVTHGWDNLTYSCSMIRVGVGAMKWYLRAFSPATRALRNITWKGKKSGYQNVAQPHDHSKTTVAQKILSMLHQPDVEMTSWAVPASDLLSNGPMLRRHHVVDCCGRSGHVGSCKIHTERIERWTSTCAMCSVKFINGSTLQRL